MFVPVSVGFEGFFNRLEHLVRVRCGWKKGNKGGGEGGRKRGSSEGEGGSIQFSKSVILSMCVSVSR